MAAGDYASCAVAAAGELFTWGNGWDGQLGHGDAALAGTHVNAPNQLLSRRVEGLHGESVFAILADIGHFVAVTHSGAVFGWGKAGALGVPGNVYDSENQAGIACFFPHAFTSSCCACAAREDKRPACRCAPTMRRLRFAPLRHHFLRGASPPPRAVPLCEIRES